MSGCHVAVHSRAGEEWDGDGANEDDATDCDVFGVHCQLLQPGFQ
jgi:hypothetical protein